MGGKIQKLAIWGDDYSVLKSIDANWYSHGFRRGNAVYFLCFTGQMCVHTGYHTPTVTLLQYPTRHIKVIVRAAVILCGAGVIAPATGMFTIVPAFYMQIQYSYEQFLVASAKLTGHISAQQWKSVGLNKVG